MACGHTSFIWWRCDLSLVWNKSSRRSLGFFFLSGTPQTTQEYYNFRIQKTGSTREAAYNQRCWWIHTHTVVNKNENASRDRFLSQAGCGGSPDAFSLDVIFWTPRSCENHQHQFQDSATFHGYCCENWIPRTCEVRLDQTGLEKLACLCLCGPITPWR